MSSPQWFIYDKDKDVFTNFWALYLSNLDVFISNSPEKNLQLPSAPDYYGCSVVTDSADFVVREHDLVGEPHGTPVGRPRSKRAGSLMTSTLT